MNDKKKEYSGTTDPNIREYEIRHREVARRAATAGIVLLKNEDHILPLTENSKVALYGSGAAYTVKGGTGSGDVNVRDVVSIWQGMESAGFEITNMEWLTNVRKIYEQARLDWREEIWSKADSLGIAPGAGLFVAYTQIPFRFPVGGKPEKTDADTAFFVLSRTAGENADRQACEGDYYFTREEEEMLHELCAMYENVVLVLNVGGVVDLSVLDRESEIKAVLNLQQPGMEGGNAFADVVSGKVSPSGKLTDTWALNYDDYPNSGWFSHNDGNVEKEFYHEDIYVGYRYFDTYQIPVRYGFGYGLSYADFTLDFLGVEHSPLCTLDSTISVKVKVSNISDKYSGQEVVQLYVSCPQEQMQKEKRRLVGYTKTDILKPKESTEVIITFPLRALESYSEAVSANVIETGNYGVYIGNSLESAVQECELKLTGKAAMEKVEHVCISEDQKKLEQKLSKRNCCTENHFSARCYVMDLCNVEEEQHTYGGQYEMPEKIRNVVDGLTVNQLIQLANGEVSANQAGTEHNEEEESGGSEIGAAGIHVPGSAAETSPCAVEQGIEPIVLADGPAGIRLIKVYYIDGDQPTAVPFDQAIEEGFLCRNSAVPTGTKHYQYCTAFPVGTMLAQTWDQKLVEEVGNAVAEEMEQFGIKLWLAPGMNIHRNPLCGRNFEYYSEDPVVTGLTAAAMVQGVEKHKGKGATIKHFACNNQEDNRIASNSILSERALREVYLKGFEIVVRKAQPMSLMTSYNLVNGVHAANSYDLCTKVLRDEWGFQGLVMTDWGTTDGEKDCTAAGCMRAGNDLVMPGTPMDHDNIKNELANGTLKLDELKRSVERLVRTIGV